MYADLSLENRAVIDVIAKTSEASREARAEAVLQTEHGLRARQAYAAIGLPRSGYHYERRNRDGPIIKLLLELAWRDRNRDSASYLSGCADWVVDRTTNVCIASIAR